MIIEIYGTNKEDNNIVEEARRRSVVEKKLEKKRV